MAAAAVSSSASPPSPRLSPPVAAGAGLLAFAVLGFLAFTYRPFNYVSLNVRWMASVTDAQRAALEQRFSLTDPVFDGGTTWKYHLTNDSTANIQALVQDAHVDDTSHIHRTKFRPELKQDRERQRLYGTPVLALVGAVAGFLLLGRRR